MRYVKSHIGYISFIKSHAILFAFLSALFILAIFQITLDYIYDENDENYDPGNGLHNVEHSDITAASETDYLIYIQIDDRTLYLLEKGKAIKQYTISPGMSGLPSPLGYWEITEMGDWGEGFGGRWMGLDVPWGKYGIHGTTEEHAIGSAASHGCIRMFRADVKELYSMVSIGTPVVIVNGSFGPFGRGFDEINPGDRGADVLEIQKRLKYLGFYNGTLDGIYDEGMKKAVHDFQRANGLKAKNTITKDDWHKMGFSEFE